MSILLRQVRVLDPGSGFHKKVVDIMIRDGRITNISEDIKGKADRTVEGDKLHVAPGFFDLGTQGGEPGLEHREDWETLSAAALAGGYTGIALFPNTKPAIDSKSGVSYILQHSGKHGVNYFPIGALSKGANGEQMAELYDMYSNGAIAFSDGRNTVHNGSLLLRALEYARSFNGWIINRPEDGPLRGSGQMHEGKMSTALGLPGIPSVAEITGLKRDIELLRYTGSKLIVHGVSTKEAVDIIAGAKKEGLDIMATVPALNLVFDDQQLLQFDSNFKVIPPLRDSSDREALLEGVRKGVIDLIVSNHEPLDIESKEKEFPHAEFGAATLERTFTMLNAHLKGTIKLPQLVEMLSITPRKALGLPVPRIAKNEKADLVVFDPKAKVDMGEQKRYSKGINDPVLGNGWKGKITATIAGQHSFISE